MYHNQEYIAEMLNALSVILGYTNLMENRAQSAQNDVHAANDEQAKLLLQELDKRFKEQNDILSQHAFALQKIDAQLTLIMRKLEVID